MEFKDNLTLERLPDAMSYLLGEIADIKTLLRNRPEDKETETYLTPQEVAEKLRVSLVTLWKYDRKGITKPVRIGGKRLYRSSDVEGILNKR